MALRNQGQLAPFACYLVFKIGNFAIDITGQKNFLSNCSKQLVTPVKLTRNFFLTNYLISRIGSELPKLKTAFYESHFPHCEMCEITSLNFFLNFSLKSRGNWFRSFFWGWDKNWKNTFWDQATFIGPYFSLHALIWQDFLTHWAVSEQNKKVACWLLLRKLVLHIF